MFFSLFRFLKQEPYKVHPLAQKLGMIQASDSLESRFKSHQNIWKEHLQNCQSSIQEFCESHPQAQSITILGSSHLFEVPIEFLLTRFKKIVLVDLVHPQKVVKLARQYPHQIELMNQDITGALHLLGQIHRFQEVINLFPNTKPSPSTDLVVSANIASQLHLLVIEDLEKKSTALTVEEKDFLAQTIFHDHLYWLKSANRPVLLFTDRKVIYRDAKGEITYSGSYAIQFDDFQKNASWVWKLASLGEMSPLYSLEMEVEAFVYSIKK